jgi:hypothetical protein
MEDNHGKYADRPKRLINGGNIERRIDYPHTNCYVVFNSDNTTDGSRPCGVEVRGVTGSDSVLYRQQNVKVVIRKRSPQITRETSISSKDGENGRDAEDPDCR